MYIKIKLNSLKSGISLYIILNEISMEVFQKEAADTTAKVVHESGMYFFVAHHYDQMMMCYLRTEMLLNGYS